MYLINQTNVCLALFQLNLRLLRTTISIRICDFTELKLFSARLISLMDAFFSVLNVYRIYTLSVSKGILKNDDTFMLHHRIVLPFPRF